MEIEVCCCWCCFGDREGWREGRRRNREIEIEMVFVCFLVFCSVVALLLLVGGGGGG